MKIQEFEKGFKRKDGPVMVAGSCVYGDREDRRKRYADAVGWDMLDGVGVDRVINLEESLADSDLGRFAHIDCVSVLEHSRRPWLIAANLERLLQPGGTLYLTVPFVWRVHAYPDDYFRFTPNGVRALFERITWQDIKYAQQKIYPVEGGLNAVTMKDYAYFPRTEVYAFGALQ